MISGKPFTNMHHLIHALSHPISQRLCEILVSLHHSSKILPVLRYSPANRLSLSFSNDPFCLLYSSDDWRALLRGQINGFRNCKQKVTLIWSWRLVETNLIY